MSPLNCAQLTGIVNNLQTDVAKVINGEFDVSAKSELAKSIRKHILKELDDKFEIVKAEYLQQLNTVKTELNIKLEADANATIRAVTGFYTSLDTKVTGLKINEDVYDNKMAEYDTKIEIMENDIRKWSERDYTLRDNYATSSVVQDEHSQSFDSEKLAELENRLNSMEDQARRDNLIYYGFVENYNEDCEKLINEFVCTRVLKDDPLAANIKVVRAHRLGKPEKDVNRPIIVKYREYADKMRILKNSKKVEKLVSDPVKPGISEDFSVATKRDREFLKTCIVSAKEHLGDIMDYGFIKYRSLVIKDCLGNYHNFHVNTIRSNSGAWLKKLERIEYS